MLKKQKIWVKNEKKKQQQKQTTIMIPLPEAKMA